MLTLSLLLVVGSITQALNTPNCTDLPKQQKAIPQGGMAAFKAEADLRGKLQQRWHQTQGPNLGRDKKLCPRLMAWMQNLFNL